MVMDSVMEQLQLEIQKQRNLILDELTTKMNVEVEKSSDILKEDILKYGQEQVSEAIASTLESAVNEKVNQVVPDVVTSAVNGAVDVTVNDAVQKSHSIALDDMISKVINITSKDIKDGALKEELNAIVAMVVKDEMLVLQSNLELEGNKHSTASEFVSNWVNKIFLFFIYLYKF